MSSVGIGPLVVSSVLQFQILLSDLFNLNEREAGRMVKVEFIGVIDSRVETFEIRLRGLRPNFRENHRAWRST